MIRATQILEAFDSYIRVPYLKDPNPIFKNPSIKEIREADGGDGFLRFTADLDTRDVYLWDGSAATHEEVREHVGLYGEVVGILCTNLLEGMARREGARAVMTDCDSIEICMSGGQRKQIEAAENLLREDWSWVQRYIRVNEFLDDLRKKYDVS